MRLTQYLIFELGSGCNLSGAHRRCPNAHPERYAHLDTSRTLDDDTIVSIATRMYREFGFRGLIGWHYYNEPMVQRRRMWQLMGRIREAIPESRFVLWTNGTIVNTNGVVLDQDLLPFAAFEQIHITDYGDDQWPTILAGELEARQIPASIHHWELDDRLDPPVEESDRPCLRMFTEFIVDNHGNVHLCCYDWRGLGSPGSVFTTPLGELVERWRAIREAISGPRMRLDPPPSGPDAPFFAEFTRAPAVCRTCSKRCGLTEFDPTIAAATTQHLAARVFNDASARIFPHRWTIKMPEDCLTAPLVVDRPPEIAVVFVAYRCVPDERILDHFRWNADYYAPVRVYMVTDRHHELPDGASGRRWRGRGDLHRRRYCHDAERMGDDARRRVRPGHHPNLPPGPRIREPQRRTTPGRPRHDGHPVDGRRRLEASPVPRRLRRLWSRRRAAAAGDATAGHIAGPDDARPGITGQPVRLSHRPSGRAR
ncbi:MAG: radical SAM/SPASM domain-containing protein [Planctomycetota bacterium]